MYLRSLVNTSPLMRARFAHFIAIRRRPFSHSHRLSIGPLEKCHEACANVLRENRQTRTRDFAAERCGRTCGSRERTAKRLRCGGMPQDSFPPSLSPSSVRMRLVVIRGRDACTCRWLKRARRDARLRVSRREKNSWHSRCYRYYFPCDINQQARRFIGLKKVYRRDRNPDRSSKRHGRIVVIL